MRRFLMIAAGLVHRPGPAGPGAAVAQGWYYPGLLRQLRDGRLGGRPHGRLHDGAGVVRAGRGVYLIDRPRRDRSRSTTASSGTRPCGRGSGSSARTRRSRRPRRKSPATRRSSRSADLESGATLNDPARPDLRRRPRSTARSPRQGPDQPGGDPRDPLRVELRGHHRLHRRDDRHGSAIPSLLMAPKYVERAQRPRARRRAGPQGGRPGERLAARPARGSTTRSPTSGTSSSRTEADYEPGLPGGARLPHDPGQPQPDAQRPEHEEVPGRSRGGQGSHRRGPDHLHERV